MALDVDQWLAHTLSSGTAPSAPRLNASTMIKDGHRTLLDLKRFRKTPNSRRQTINRLDPAPFSSRQKPVKPHSPLSPLYIPPPIIPSLFSPDLPALALGIARHGQRFDRERVGRGRGKTGREAELPAGDLRGPGVEKGGKGH
jgi:hypothetical protein